MERLQIFWLKVWFWPMDLQRAVHYKGRHRLEDIEPWLAVIKNLVGSRKLRHD